VTLTRGTAILVCLALLPAHSASAKSITDQEIVRFVRTVFKSAEVSDTVLRALLQEKYEGIPYRAWIALILAGEEAYRLIGEGRRVEAARLLAETQLNFALSQFAVALGGSSVFAIVQLGVLPIKVSLDKFIKVVDDLGLRVQIDCYFKARALRPIGETHESILQKRSLSGEVFFSDEGWLFAVGGERCERVGVVHPIQLNVRQTLEVARWLWDIGESRRDFLRQRESILRAIKASASLGEIGLIQISWRATAPAADCSGPMRSGRTWADPGFDDLVGWRPIRLPDVSTPERDTWKCETCDRYYRGKFSIRSVPAQAWLAIASDDGLRLYINGHLIGQWGGVCHTGGCVNNPYRCVDSVTLPPFNVVRYLRPGANVVAAHVSDVAYDKIFNLCLAFGTKAEAQRILSSCIIVKVP